MSNSNYIGEQNKHHHPTQSQSSHIYLRRKIENIASSKELIQMQEKKNPNINSFTCLIGLYKHNYFSYFLSETICCRNKFTIVNKKIKSLISFKQFYLDKLEKEEKMFVDFY